jgi:Bacterial Ig-like domain
MRLRGCLLLLVLLCLGSLPAPAGAVDLPGDPVVVADDSQGAPGTFFKAVERVSLLDGAVKHLTAGNALPQANALTFTGIDTLVTVGGQALGRLNLASEQLVNVTAPGSGDMRGVAQASDGSLIATDLGPGNGTEADGRVLRIDPVTSEATAISSGGELNNPLGIAIAEDDTIYVTDLGGDGHGQVLEIDPSDGAQNVIAAAPLSIPWGIAFLPNGDLVLADEGYNGAFQGALVRIDPATGAQTPRFLESLQGSIDNATGVAVDNLGRVLVTERSTAQIDRIDLDTGVAEQIGQGPISPLDIEPTPGEGPATRLTGGPAPATRDTTPTFTFEPSQYGATSSCLIDGGPAVPCRRTFTTPPLGPGPHSVRVTSTRFGVTGPAAARDFTVDPTALDTVITSGPSGPTNDPTPTFTFEAPAGETLFTCEIDGAVATPCTSPFEVAAPLAEGNHTFTVKAAGDDIGDSRSFTVDTTPPEASITSGPVEGAATNSTQPTFTFASSEEPSTFLCTLDEQPVPCTSVFTVPAPLPEGQHTVTVAAVDSAGNITLAPLIRNFTVDTTAPQTTVTGGPDGTTDVAAPTFTFSGSEPGVTFRCAVDGAAPALCASPFTVAPALADGPHTFRVQAADGAGNIEAAAQQREFTVDTLVPDTSITAGPNGLTNDRAPAFSFESTKPGSTFACELDGGGSAPCQTPFQTGPLGEGAHTFTVTATDALGHPDPTPATQAFTVDTTPPRTTLDAGPGLMTNDRTPEFAFSSEQGATFTCAFDAGVVEPCTSPFTAPPLSDGFHTFRVQATDAAGNVEGASSVGFVVDTVAPQTTITSGPEGGTDIAAPTFTFSGSEPVVTFRCSVDGAAPAVCASPFTIAPALADGPHTFRVQATDPAGNVEATPPQRSFTVDAVPPVDPISPETHIEPEVRPPEPAQRIDPQLRLRTSIHKGRLRVRVTLSPAATGSVTVSVKGRRGQLRLSRKLQLGIVAGTATGSLRLPAGIPLVRLRADYGGDARHTVGSAALTVRQAQQGDRPR